MKNRLFASLFLGIAIMASPSDARAAPALNLSDFTVFYSLTRLYVAQARKVVPFMHTRVESFLSEAGKVPFTGRADPSRHYQKMMHELMTSYDLLQTSKPYLNGVLFSQLSRKWQFIHDRVVQSQKYFARDKTTSARLLAEAVSDAGAAHFVLKSLDVIL